MRYKSEERVAIVFVRESKDINVQIRTVGVRVPEIG